MNGKFKISGKLGYFWLFALAVILVVGIYLTKSSVKEEAVQVFAGGAYEPSNRSFTDLIKG